MCGGGGLLSALAPLALNFIAPGIGGAIGSALDIGSTGGSALLGAGLGALTNSKNPLTGALEGAGGSLVSGALGGLSGIGQDISAPNNIFDSISNNLGSMQDSFANSSVGQALGIPTVQGSGSDFNSLISNLASQSPTDVQGAASLGTATPNSIPASSVGVSQSLGGPFASDLSSTNPTSENNLFNQLTGSTGSTPGNVGNAFSSDMSSTNPTSENNFFNQLTGQGGVQNTAGLGGKSLSPSSPLSPSGILGGITRNPLASALTILQAIQSSKPNSAQQIYAQQQAQQAQQNALFNSAMTSPPGTYNYQTLTPQQYANYAYGTGNKQLVNFTGNSNAPAFADGGQVPDPTLDNLIYNNILVPPTSNMPARQNNIPTMATGGINPIGLNNPGLSAQNLLSTLLYGGAAPQLYGYQPPAQQTSTQGSGTGTATPQAQASGGMNNPEEGDQYIATMLPPNMPQSPSPEQQAYMAYIMTNDPQKIKEYEDAHPEMKQGKANGGLMNAVSGGSPQPVSSVTPSSTFSVTPYSTGQLFNGPGGGQSDNIDAGNAYVSPGEFVHRAAVTAAAGDGNPTAGAQKLNEFGQNLLKDYATKITQKKGKNPPKVKSLKKYMPKKASLKAPKD